MSVSPPKDGLGQTLVPSTIFYGGRDFLEPWREEPTNQFYVYGHIFTIVRSIDVSPCEIPVSLTKSWGYTMNNATLKGKIAAPTVSCSENYAFREVGGTSEYFLYTHLPCIPCLFHPSKR
jgi:hypothetical protein